MNSDELLRHLAIWPLATLILLILAPFVYIGLRNMFGRKDNDRQA